MGLEIGRRDFIVRSSAAVCAAGLAAKPDIGQAEIAKKSKIVEVFHSKAVSENRKVDSDAISAMVKKGMEALTKSKQPFKDLFKPGEKIGLKINALGRPLMVTHHELVNAIATELVAVGIKENDIVVWDRFANHMLDSKYKLNDSTKGVRYIATETDADKKSRYSADVVYSSSSDKAERRDEWGEKSPLSKILLEDCDKIINLAILKDHGMAGVTLCLKNIAYGVTCNNARFHSLDNIDKFIVDICDMKQVKDKMVLHIVDGIEGCFDNGPLPRDLGSIFAPKTLWLSKDPVAIDAVCRNVIEAKRKEKGIASLAAVGRPGSHIELAAGRGLGACDLRKIEIQKITI